MKPVHFCEDMSIPCDAISDEAVEMREARDISSIMRKVHSRNTTPEINLRNALRKAGIFYRLRTDDLPGKPDLILPGPKLAVFIDGDYWHGGQWSKRGLTCLEQQFRKTENSEYWLRKIRGNMRRDVDSTARLLAEGWKVIRLWESSIKNDLAGCVSMVKEASEAKTGHDFSAWTLPEKKVAEFFAGIGLVRVGLESRNWRVIYANDIDLNKHQMYSDHFGNDDEAFDLRDVKDVRGFDIPDVTLATASFPCNDTSLAGSRKGLKGEKSSTFWEFIRILSEMADRRPPIVMIENVTGFLTSGSGKDFAAALQALNELGYLVDTFQLDAANFVPQSRKRLFIIGILQALWPWESCRHDPDEAMSSTRPRKLVQFIRSNSSVKWLIRRLPCPPEMKNSLKDCVDDIPDDSPLWWSAQRAAYLLAQMNPEHRLKAQTMIDDDQYNYGTVFRRVRKEVTRAEIRNDGLAGCLRTPRGGSARQILFRGGKGGFRVRLLTARECARLMGASDFNIKVHESKALYGFGDAVAPPVIEWISIYYLEPLINQLLRGRVLIRPRKMSSYQSEV